MCTLAVALGTDRRFPVVVAANRDERLARPSEGWALRDGKVRYAAPRDVEAGGTWMGVNARGLFAGVTNYMTGRPPDRARRSRGDLVPLALAHASAAEARAEAAALDAARFNPFHLVVADAASAFLWAWDGDRATLEPLGPGLHVVTERDPRGLDPRGDLVRARWPVDLSVARLRELLTVHSNAPPEEPFAATCLHMGEVYGTRSSAILRLGPSLAHAELYAADGRPCEAPHEDRTELLQKLARSP